MSNVRHLCTRTGGFIGDNAGFAAYLHEVADLVASGYYPDLSALVVLMVSGPPCGSTLHRVSTAKGAGDFDTHRLLGILEEAKHAALSK